MSYLITIRRSPGLIHEVSGVLEAEGISAIVQEYPDLFSIHVSIDDRKQYGTAKVVLRRFLKKLPYKALSDFIADYRASKEAEEQDKRLGQAFCGEFDIYFPDLFYCDSEEKAIKAIFNIFLDIAN